MRLVLRAATLVAVVLTAGCFMFETVRATALTQACIGADCPDPGPTGDTGMTGTTGTTNDTTVPHHVGGTVSGLTSAGLVLFDNGGDALTVDADGAFQFVTALAPGSAYAVTVSSAPVGMQCVVSAGVGLIDQADIASVVVACTPAPMGPHLFFTDILSGPNTGGENNLGVFITLYGLNLGATRGTSKVTIGGVEVASYTRWGDAGVARGLEMVVVQPGPGVPAGAQQIVATVGGVASEPLPFTVRAGLIYFANNTTATTGGTDPSTPFGIYEARNHMVPGDVVYLRGGTYGALDDQPTDCDAVHFLCINGLHSASGTTSGTPVAYVGYPGEIVHFATSTAEGIDFGVESSPTANPVDHYVIASVTLTDTSAESVYVGNSDLRLVGLSISGAQSNSLYSAIMIDSPSSAVKVLGTVLTSNSNQAPIRVAASTNDVEIGWSEVRNTSGAGGIELLGGTAISVHDSLITGNSGAGIRLSGSVGAVTIQNNVIANNTGFGIDDSAHGGGHVVRHNTLYANGLGQMRVNADSGALSIDDNIFASLVAQPCVSVTGTPAAIVSGKNDFFSCTAGISTWAQSGLTGDPGLAAPAGGDFRLSPTSTAIDAASASPLTRDYRGVSRPQGSTPDIGAFERYLSEN